MSSKLLSDRSHDANHPPYRLLLALCAAGLCTAPAAVAESGSDVAAMTEADPDEKRRTERARRSQAAIGIDLPINDTDQSVSLLTHAWIETLNPPTLADALHYTPGVYGGGIDTSNRYDYVALRGFNEQITGNEWLDGLRLPGDTDGNNMPQIDPWIVERADVVRGPDSALYGRMSPGGLVALQSKRPRNTLSRQIAFGVGNDDRRWAALDTTGPLAGRADLSYRLLVKTQKEHAPQPGATSERHLLAPSLLWRINRDNRLLLQAYLQNEPGTGYHSSVPYAGSAVDQDGQRLPTSFYEGVPGDGMKRQMQLFGYGFEHDFNPRWQFRQQVRYQKLRIAGQQTYQTGWLPSSPTTLGREVAQSQEHGAGFAFDNRLQGQFATGPLTHILLVGFNADRFDNDGYAQYGSASPLSPFTGGSTDSTVTFRPANTIDHQRRGSGIYLHDRLSLAGWRLDLGVRSDRAMIRNASNTENSDAEWRGDNVSQRIGLSYVAANGLTSYANYSEGFDLAASYYADADGRIPGPQQSRQKELGLKFQPGDGRSYLSFAAYTLQQGNIVVRNPASPGYLPIGVVAARGVELEARVALGRRLSLHTSLTANRMRIKTGENANNTPFGVPARMASLWADYSFENGISTAMGIRHIGTQWIDNANTARLASVTLLDMALRYALARLDRSLKGVDLRLTASNLLDRRYVAGCYDSQINCYYGSTRTLTLSAGYRW